MIKQLKFTCITSTVLILAFIVTRANACSCLGKEKQTLSVTGDRQVDTYSIDSLFKRVPELTIETTLPDSVFSSYFKIIRLEQSDGITLRADSTFESVIRSSFSKSGKWRIDKREKQIVFNSNQKKQERFYVVKYWGWLYLVRPQEIRDFVNRFNVSRKKHKNAKPFELETGGKLYTWEFLVASDLANKTYVMNWSDDY
ncbi:hypothetical protein [Segetibacter aerophilus]|uniref:Lipoprotein n=1 Tax=Segetibacter aerophilus TaxID=670293 RepID=A0A512BGW2_9BACT|nr:hypothetical protein [Segetibacter aerophilus]GEO11115.1 hypothetical protein SAE01_36110 [Segetibacter aerophilus]